MKGKKETQKIVERNQRLIKELRNYYKYLPKSDARFARLWQKKNLRKLPLDKLEKVWYNRIIER